MGIGDLSAGGCLRLTPPAIVTLRGTSNLVERRIQLMRKFDDAINSFLRQLPEPDPAALRDGDVVRYWQLGGLELDRLLTELEAATAINAHAAGEPALLGLGSRPAVISVEGDDFVTDHIPPSARPVQIRERGHMIPDLDGGGESNFTFRTSQRTRSW
jgi:hypothetical protein